jgi:hypothetical protein
MTTFTVTVRLLDLLSEADIEALYERLDDEVGVETGPNGSFLTFEKQADRFFDVVLDVLVQIMKAGVQPVAVEDELVSIADIAERLGRTRQSVSMLVRGQRGSGDFPAPVAGGVRSPLWHWSDVSDWFAGRSRPGMPGERAISLAAINGMLATRILRRLHPEDAKQIRKRLAG